MPFKVIEFVWDDGNKQKNWLKHCVETDECEQVFLQEKIITFVDEKHSSIEQRWLVLGVTDKGRKLSIFFTIRNKKIRIISARDMSKKEKMMYEEQN